jgi:colicin import membrane protein
MQLRNYAWPICVSVIFHGALIAFVVAGWEWSPQPQPSVTPPRYIEAKLVELKPKAKQVAAQPAKPPKVDLTKRRQEEEAARKRAEEKRAQERRAQEKREREAAQKRQQEEKRKQEELRRQKELEAQRQAEQQAREQQERQRAMQEELQQALQEEKGQVLEEQYATQAASYMDAIARRIEQNWNRPPSARNDMQATLSIQLVPTGRVVSVSVSKSSGNAAFDRSAERAVRQVEVFPEIKDMPPEVFERYYRRFNLLFNPQDLRQ